MTTLEAYETLRSHRDNLLEVNSWEAYRDAHVKYVEMLMHFYKAEVDVDNKQLDLVCEFTVRRP